MEGQSKWQPVMLVVSRRVECKCGALAIFVTGKLTDNPDEYAVLEDVDVWCQECWQKEQEEE